ncbi:Jag N-terminal domain-containing protein [candidate division FCPU426 bacterium]|nr:Jag N-terminal domain-containing protein [candidate division FCPU426 bacterium]
MKEVTKEAKTVEAAIVLALKALGCAREEAEIEIVQEPIKGIFGMAKMAKVRATSKGESSPDELKEEETERRQEEAVGKEEMQAAAQMAQNSIKYILTQIGMQNIKIKTREEEENTVILDIHCESEGLLIGRHGQTLASLQYLVNRILHHKANRMIRYVVDVGGYKTRHKTILEKMAKRIAQKVAETKEEEQLKAMSAYDRRIIHLCIKDNPDVVTYSLGEGNFRRVVIAPKGKTAPKEQ